jgi:hypothetical protein
LGALNIVHSQTKKVSITKAIIKYESFTTTTSEAVKCQYFEATFKETIKAIVVEDRKKIALLSTDIQKMKPVENQKSIDVRLKLTLYRNRSELEYCMDRYGVFLDSEGKCFENKSLHNFITAQLPSGGW